MKHIRKAILPVAGLGTRFLPATKAQPKEMLPIVDTPVIQFLVEEAVDAGIEEIIFVTGKGKRAIEDHFDYAPEIERVLRRKGKTELEKEMRRISDQAHFVYVRQRQPRGPGDALLAARTLVSDDEPVAVLFGDDIVVGAEGGLVQMARAYESLNAPIIALDRVEKRDVEHYGIVSPARGEKKNNPMRIDGIVEKPRVENAPSRLAAIGKYIITPAIWRELQNLKPDRSGEIGLTEALNKSAVTDAVYGLELAGERFDCGSKIGFLKATVHMGLEHDETAQAFKKYLKRLSL